MKNHKLEELLHARYIDANQIRLVLKADNQPMENKTRPRVYMSLLNYLPVATDDWEPFLCSKRTLYQLYLRECPLTPEDLNDLNVKPLLKDQVKKNNDDSDGVDSFEAIWKRDSQKNRSKVSQQLLDDLNGMSDGDERVGRVLALFIYLRGAQSYVSGFHLLVRQLLQIFNHNEGSSIDDQESDVFWLLDAIVQQVLPTHPEPWLTLVNLKQPDLHSVLKNEFDLVVQTWFSSLFLNILNNEKHKLIMMDSIIGRLDSAAFMLHVGLQVLEQRNSEIKQQTNSLSASLAKPLVASDSDEDLFVVLAKADESTQGPPNLKARLTTLFKKTKRRIDSGSFSISSSPSSTPTPTPTSSSAGPPSSSSSSSSSSNESENNESTTSQSSKSKKDDLLSPVRSFIGSQYAEGIFGNFKETGGTQRSGYCSCQGKRITMEDTEIVCDDVFAEFPQLKTALPARTTNCSFYAVFDGHAGTRAAVYLKDNLLQCIVDCLCANPEQEPTEALRQAFVETDRKLIRESTDAQWADGSTAVCCLIVDDQLHFANCGDAESIIARRTSKPSNSNPEENTAASAATGNNEKDKDKEQDTEQSGSELLQAECVTKIHRPSDEQERERVMLAGGFCVFGRVNGMLAVSRAFGDRMFKKPASSSNGDLVIADPYTCSLSSSLVEYIVVACDGLYDTMKYQEIVDLLASPKFRAISPEDQATRLVEASLMKGSMDNVTVIVIKL